MTEAAEVILEAIDMNCSDGYDLDVWPDKLAIAIIDHLNEAGFVVVRSQQRLFCDD